MGRVMCAQRAHITQGVSAIEILTTYLGLLYKDRKTNLNIQLCIIRDLIMPPFENYQETLIPVDFDPFAEGELLLTAPATESQKEIWLSVQMGQEANCAYNESGRLHLQGSLNLEALRSAIQHLIQRHEALRMTFDPDGKTTCIAETLPIEIPLVDLSTFDAQAQTQHLTAIYQQVVEEPFNLEHGPLFRAQVIKLKDHEHVLVLTTHHIICDGWSWGVMIPDLGNLYGALHQNITPELDDPERFSDYALALTQAEGGAENLETLNYWLAQFTDSVPILDFPTDHPRPPLRSFTSKREDWDLSSDLVASLKQLGTTLGCSFMTTMLSAFEVFLHRLTCQDDITLGVFAAGQASSGCYNLVGHCVNALPLRTQVDPHQSFSTYLKSRKSKVLDAYDHQEFTFGSLLKELPMSRDPSRIPLIPIVFNIDQGLDPDKLSFGNLTVEFFSNPRSYENFELFINATELKGKVTLECQYNTNLFEGETIRQRMAEFEVLLRGVVADPDRAIATVPILPDSETELLSRWNDTRTDFPHDRCIHHLIETQAAQTPNAIAVTFQNQSLTYADLSQKSNQLAQYLQSLGVMPDTLIALACDRGLEMIIGLLGILKAGAAYVPIDPAYPIDRVAFMLEDARINILLTTDHLEEIFTSFQIQIIRLDGDWNSIVATNDGSNLKDQAQSESLAYLIYTSGSTGKPKGVQIQHRSMVNFLVTMWEKPGLKPDDILLSVTTLSFDIAAVELLLPLTVGATIILVGRDIATDGNALRKVLEDSSVTVMQATPTTWLMLLAAGWTGSKQLTVFCTGEALPYNLAQQLHPTVQSLWNMYGPTETTIWATIHDMQSSDIQRITIGHPIANTQIYIVDPQLQVLPIGVPGELYIGGEGLARGYLNRPELTAERFVPNPYGQPGTRLYRTGDLARWLPNGQIECLGRIDYQVKVRGFRIELGEIETNLLQYAGIKEAVVTVRDDKVGEPTLCGYFVPGSGSAEDSYELIPELRQFLKSKLPDFMVPTSFMALDQMPLTPNGKVNRKALPKPDIAKQLASHYVAPRTDLEEQICEVWKQILDLDQVGIHDNFFELGGYSLLGVQIVSRLRQALGVEILLPILFELPTVADLAKRIEALLWAAKGLTLSQDFEEDNYEEGEL